jgi:hypothetical protein
VSVFFVYAMVRLGLTRSAENRHLQDPEDIAKFLNLAEYIRNGGLRVSPYYDHVYNHLFVRPSETLALYSLSKYRHLKRLGY